MMIRIIRSIIILKIGMIRIIITTMIIIIIMTVRIRIIIIK